MGGRTERNPYSIEVRHPEDPAYFSRSRHLARICTVADIQSIFASREVHHSAEMAEFRDDTSDLRRPSSVLPAEDWEQGSYILARPTLG
jgi:hypothetical protein